MNIGKTVFAQVLEHLPRHELYASLIIGCVLLIEYEPLKTFLCYIGLIFFLDKMHLIPAGP